MAYRQNPIESEEEGEEEVEEEDKDEGKGHQIILCMQKCIKKKGEIGRLWIKAYSNQKLAVAIGQGGCGGRGI